MTRTSECWQCYVTSNRRKPAGGRESKKAHCSALHLLGQDLHSAGLGDIASFSPRFSSMPSHVKRCIAPVPLLKARLLSHDRLQSRAAPRRANHSCSQTIAITSINARMSTVRGKVTAKPQRTIYDAFAASLDAIWRAADRRRPLGKYCLHHDSDKSTSLTRYRPRNLRWRRLNGARDAVS